MFVKGRSLSATGLACIRSFNLPLQITVSLLAVDVPQLRAVFGLVNLGSIQSIVKLRFLQQRLFVEGGRCMEPGWKHTVRY